MPGLLNISEAMSIALHTCAFLALNGEGFSSAKRISDRLGFSANHSTKVVRQLVRAGILQTVRGPSGGARLARAPCEISLLEICVAAGGRPEYSGCLLKSEICDGQQCVLGQLLQQENRRLVTLLKSTMLEDVAQSLKHKSKEKRTTQI